MTAPDLDPTRTRLALLADIDAGAVRDDPDFTPHMHFDDGLAPARVATAVWELYRAGWVEQPTGDRKWALTDLGRQMMLAGQTDG